MIGAMPDYQATLAQYQDLQQQRQRGSARHRQCAGASESVCARWAGIARGLCSAPLTGEILAAQLFGEPLPSAAQMLAALNSNRMWIRKLLKGRAV